MGTCVNHPERETRFICMKHNRYLCEECLKCQDPEIYCKFRPQCAIWFMEKRGKAWAEEDRAAIAENPGNHCTVRFLPDDRPISVERGVSLLEAAARADVHLNASCNGKGSCGKCKLILEEGKVTGTPSPLLSDTEKEKGYLLACQNYVDGNLTVRVPAETIERKLKVAGMGEAVTAQLAGLVSEITPMVVDIPLDLPVPTLDDSVSDLDRLRRALKKRGIDTDRLRTTIDVVRGLAQAEREENWHVTARILHRRCHHEILDVRPGQKPVSSLGLAVDVGTTSIVVYLVDMADGRILAATSGHNRQSQCGDDIINRIVCAEKNGVKKLSRMGLRTINGLISEALASAETEMDYIRNIVLSGNTTMIHLLLGIEPRYIRREPYIPTVAEFPILQAGDIGLKADPKAGVFIMPGPASYVGGDIVSGMIYAGFHREAPLTLFIDVGTNGEIVLGNRDWLVTASCSAGPAFEGGGIRWGMRAEEGAIEGVSIDPNTFDPTIQTVGDQPARGICGSGMIDLLAEMFLTGVVAPNGKLRLDPSHPRLAMIGDEPAYVLVFSGETPMGEDILFTETDVENFIRSKAAVYAGFSVLLNQMGLDFFAVERFLISGGFGQHLDIDRAVTIGLLPDIDREKFIYLGNSSASGAYMALLSESYRREAERVSNGMTYIDFSSNAQFMDEFTSAQFLPHTNTAAFPSVIARFTASA